MKTTCGTPEDLTGAEVRPVVREVADHLGVVRQQEDDAREDLTDAQRRDERVDVQLHDDEPRDRAAQRGGADRDERGHGRGQVTVQRQVDDQAQRHATSRPRWRGRRPQRSRAPGTRAPGCRSPPLSATISENVTSVRKVSGLEQTEQHDEQPQEVDRTDSPRCQLAEQPSRMDASVPRDFALGGGCRGLDRGDLLCRCHCCLLTNRPE